MDNDNIHSAYRGDIFYADLEPVRGSEQGGVRPVLIIQNDIGNRHSPTVIVAAITSRIKHHPTADPCEPERKAMWIAQRINDYAGTAPNIR